MHSETAFCHLPNETDPVSGGWLYAIPFLFLEENRGGGSQEHSFFLILFIKKASETLSDAFSSSLLCRCGRKKEDLSVFRFFRSRCAARGPGGLTVLAVCFLIGRGASPQMLRRRRGCSQPRCFRRRCRRSVSQGRGRGRFLPHGGRNRPDRIFQKCGA